MTDADADTERRLPPPRVIDREMPPADPQRGGPLASVTGADRAALGLDPEPGLAPPGAEVDASETSVPGPKFGDWPAAAEKPWETSLATKSDDAGIGAEPDAEGKI